MTKQRKSKKSKKSDGPIVLSGRATRHLRALGHALDPVVSIGKNGVTDALVAQTTSALRSHELVKVRVQGEAPVDRREAAEELARATRSALAQVIGRTFLLYKPHPEKPRIALPPAKKTRPAAPARAPGSAPGNVGRAEAELEGDDDDVEEEAYDEADDDSSED